LRGDQGRADDERGDAGDARGSILHDTSFSQSTARNTTEQASIERERHAEVATVMEFWATATGATALGLAWTSSAATRVASDLQLVIWLVLSNVR